MVFRRLLFGASTVCVALWLCGCSPGGSSRTQFFCVLVDTTGSFSAYWPEALQTVRYLAEKTVVVPGTEYCLIGIDDDSYPADNVLLGPVMLARKSLLFKGDKKKLLAALDDLKFTPSSRPGTDIQGALHRVAEYAAEHPDEYWLDLLILCDMQEEHNSQQYGPVSLSVPTRVNVLFMPQVTITYRDEQGKLRKRAETQAEFVARQDKWRGIFASYGVPNADRMKFNDPKQSSVRGGFTTRVIDDLTDELMHEPTFPTAAPVSSGAPPGEGPQPRLDPN